MAIIAANEKVFMVSNSTNTTYSGSASLKAMNQWYTMQDVKDTVGVAAEGPQGVPGVQGEQGIPGTAGAVGPAGLNWQSTWVSGTSYVADDAVAYDGASWFCILATSGTTAPDLDTTHWALLASQGAQGVQGIQGIAGQQGIQGIEGPPSAQNLQQTVALGNTVSEGGFTLELTSSSIKVDEISTGISAAYNSDKLVFGKNTYTTQLTPASTLTANRVVSLPNASGTIALLSDIPSAAVPTLTQVLTAGNVVLDTNATFLASSGAQTLIYPGDLTVIYGSETADLYPSSLTFANSSGTIELRPPGTITGAPTVTLPNTTGTVALTSNIPSFIVNNTASALSLATLNSTYSTAIVGSRVSCVSISGGGLLYTKTGTSTWVSSSITAVT